MRIKSTYENCKTLIMAGRVVETMLDMLSLFCMVGAISNEQYVELAGMLPAAAPDGKE